MHDVLIVGAGVAGSATGIHLARMGRSVRLVDRARFPRRKACGEGVFPRGVRELRNLGVLDKLKLRAELQSLRFKLGSVSAEARIASADLPAMGIRRELLDVALLDRARETGVEVENGIDIDRLIEGPKGFRVATAAGEEFEARFVIAADGARSALRRQAGLDSSPRGSRYGVSAHVVLMAEPPSQIQVQFERGYEVYVTPIGGRLVNVALLLNRSRMGGLAGNLRASFLELFAAWEGFADFSELVDEPLATGPFPASCRSAWSRNLVLAGDAAGFCDPITGEGISLALVGARQCADAIDRALDGAGPQPLRDYERTRDRLARDSNLFARLMLTLASRPALARRVLGNLSRHPETFARLIAVNSGEAGWASLRPRDLSAFVAGI